MKRKIGYIAVYPREIYTEQKIFTRATGFKVVMEFSYLSDALTDDAHVGQEEENQIREPIRS